MSTGKRLAKRSIIGTRVSARGKDGKYYNGYIHALKTSASALAKDTINISSNTLYSVRFDMVPGTKPPSPNTEFAGRDLIAPGFESIDSATFVAGQKVYLTYNGREIQAEVTQHRKQLDEVDVMIAPNGQEGTVILKKRIDELRLSESRKSPRLADQDTDFARLADMGSDRKRSASHSIDLPHILGSRKRRPSSSYDSERPYGNTGATNNGGTNGAVGGGWQETPTRVPRGCGRIGCPTNERGDCMDECTAALVLMSLSCSPNSPYNSMPFHCQQKYGSWGDNSVVAPSPGVTSGSNTDTSSSGASWRTATPSPNFSEDGTVSTVITIWPQPAYHPPNNNKRTSPFTASVSPADSTPSSGTWDEGIERDYDDEEMRPCKKTKKCRTERKVKRDRVENRRPCTGYNAVSREQSASPDEIRPENSPVPQRPALVPVRSVPVAQRSAQVAQRPTIVAQRSATVAPRSVLTAQRSSPPVQRETPTAQRSPNVAETVVETADNREADSPPAYNFENNKPPCTWPSCTVVKATDAEIEEHVRSQHLQPQKKMESAQGIVQTVVYGEEEFYYQEVEAKTMSSPPTLSHRDMARPPHEDPEYQRQLRLEAAPATFVAENNATTGCINNNNKMPQVPRSASVIKQNKGNTLVTFGVSSLSRPSMKQKSTTVKKAPRRNAAVVAMGNGKPPPARKVRREVKKCRKMHGMHNREHWCTQCRWKKACTRYRN